MSFTSSLPSALLALAAAYRDGTVEVRKKHLNAG